MKIYTILDHIDNGHMALPEFQRGYVWNRDQVRGLFDSLYKRHPIGGLLVWATESISADHRGGTALAPGIVKLLLDGQQRITTLYGITRGKPPKFFDGDSQIFEGLHFHLEEKSFMFYQPLKMKDDPLWVNVTELIKNRSEGLSSFITKLSNNPATTAKVGDYVQRLSQLQGIMDVDLHIEEVTGKDKTIDIVVDIFNRVNSGGTKLSKGDLALAKICSDWPEAREKMKAQLKKWEKYNYNFNIDWLLRSVNTVLTGEAKFIYLHDKTAAEIQNGLDRAIKHIDTSLNMIGNRLGLDHDQVLFGKFGIPVMVRYLDKKGSALSDFERDKLLFWYVQSGMWGRFSGSTESFIDKDLEVLEDDNGGLDKLIEQLRLWHGGLRVEPDHFDGWSLGARFYPILYFITRMGSAKDWGTGLELKAYLLGRRSALEVHHIFPKAQLYKQKFTRPEVNALSNFCFLTKTTNINISDRLPEQYFPEIETNHPGALESQWIPMDEKLWKIENFKDFLNERKKLLAEEVNFRMTTLLHGDNRFISGSAPVQSSAIEIPGGIGSQEEEEQLLEEVNAWVTEQNLPKGILTYELVDEETGEQKAILDLAWPQGIQVELSQPVALLLGKSSETIALISQEGYKCFTKTEALIHYISTEILGSLEEPSYISAAQSNL
jgi:hypothetical protein